MQGQSYNFNLAKKRKSDIFEIKWKDIAFGEYTGSDLKSPIIEKFLPNKLQWEFINKLV